MAQIKLKTVLPCCHLVKFACRTFSERFTSAFHSLMICLTLLSSCIAVWLSGNVLVSIDEVTVHRARLMLGWVISADG